MNDGIRKEHFSVQCLTVDDIVDGIMSFGRIRPNCVTRNEICWLRKVLRT